MSPKRLRPTSARLQKAIFDILNSMVEIKNFKVLDLFCGSGNLGIWAMSLGAKEVIFVDNNLLHIKIAKRKYQFWLKTAANKKGKVSFICKDTFRIIKTFNKKKVAFDLILADPPYDKGLAKRTLLSLDERDILQPFGIIVIEHQRREFLPERTNNFRQIKQRKYGDSVVSFYKLRKINS
jgi:16S rRNA (guanine(966)-N(2))-methyltransferase RsmD